MSASIKSFAKSALQRTGALALVRLRYSDRNRILTYHNFPAECLQTFEAQCSHLARTYSSVSLTEVAEYVSKGRKLPPHSFVFTVDDGYRDFYLNAYPLLKKYGIPATVFLTTDFLDGKIWQWWDQLRYAIVHSPQGSAVVELEMGEPVEYPLHDQSSRSAAMNGIVEKLKRIPNRKRVEFISSLGDLFHVEIPATAPLGLEPMSWDEVRELANNGVTFGAHTRRHPILSRVETEEELKDEVEGSRDRIAKELGKPPSSFCYPNGREMDVGSRVQEIVKNAGFQCAVSTMNGLNRPGINPFMMNRLGLDPSEPYFPQKVSGLGA